MVITSMTVEGQRPDGRSYGTWPFVSLTECPGNGFVYFDDQFSKEEVAELTPLVFGTEYQAMRKTETPRYRGWWLMSHIGRDPFAKSAMLLGATWESDGDLDRKARYQRSFTSAATNLPWSEENRNRWFWLNLRAANALRELGDFQKSTALIASINLPERLPTGTEERHGAQFMINGLLKLNAERNSATEPANLIPAGEAAGRCLYAWNELTASEIEACERKDVRKIKDWLATYLIGH